MPRIVTIVSANVNTNVCANLQVVKTIAERLIKARTHRGLSQRQLAAAADVAPSTIGNIEAGIRQAKGSLPQIAEALRVRHKWLVEGVGEMTDGAGGGAAPMASEDVAPYGALLIPRLANGASMGPGADALHEDVVVGALPIAPDWVANRIRPTSPKNLRFIPAYGDSMVPTFSDGDVLLVDTGVKDVTIDGVYVLCANSQLFVKRVERSLDGRSMTVTSDNATSKAVNVLNGDTQVDILGRVVWCWNGKKL